MKRVLLPLAIFVIYLSIVGLGATARRHSELAREADLALLAINFALVVFLSVLVVADKWNGRRGPTSRPTLLRRIRDWMTDEPTLK